MRQSLQERIKINTPKKAKEEIEKEVLDNIAISGKCELKNIFNKNITVYNKIIADLQGFIEEEDDDIETFQDLVKILSTMYNNKTDSTVRNKSIEIMNILFKTLSNKI